MSLSDFTAGSLWEVICDDGYWRGWFPLKTGEVIMVTGSPENKYPEANDPQCTMTFLHCERHYKMNMPIEDIDGSFLWEKVLRQLNK